MEKMLFPAFLLIFQVIFLILYGVLVEYDDLGSPIKRNGTITSVAEGQFSASTARVVSTYPGKL